MNEKLPASPEIIDNERLETIWEKAINQNAETREALEKIDKPKALEILRVAAQRMRVFEALADADKANNLQISPEVAEKIGSIWLFSGVGTYDKPLKEERTIDGKTYPGDNPLLADKPFLLGGNRRRINQGIWLARRIAEARSGKKIEAVPPEKLPEQREAIKKLIAEYGPYIVFGGYDIENIEAEELLEQERTVMPKEKVLIAIRKDGVPMKTTTDQVHYFESPEEVRDMQVAFVSDGTHLNRILHIAKKFPEHLPIGKPVNLFPSAIPEYGREEFANMELQGLLAYMYKDHVAAEEPHPYTLER